MSNKANVITLHSGGKNNKKASFLWSPRKGVSAAWRVGAQPAVLDFTGVPSERVERLEERDAANCGSGGDDDGDSVTPLIIDSGNSREEQTGARSTSLARAIALYEKEHGDCGQNTCDCSVAYRLGHLRLAIDLFARSGSGSREFTEAHSDAVRAEGGPHRWERALSAERDSMCREEHLACPQCGVVLWLPDETDYECDACGHRIVDQIDEA